MWFFELKKLNGREMKTLFILSIVVPVSLLTTLRLTGILQGPTAISETTTLEAVRWEFERTQPFQTIGKKLDVTYVQDGLSTKLRLLICNFVDGSPSDFCDSFMTMSLAVNSTAINPNAFVKNVDVVFNEYSQPSTVNWEDTCLDFKNLSLVALSSGYGGEQYEKAFVRLSNQNNAEEVSFSVLVMWYLWTSNTLAHQAEITYELTYFNGTDYKKIIQPFQLKIAGR